jgi:stalled ribosome rescue protein Dom34
MQDGLANLCLIKEAMTKVVAKIERTLPKKGGLNDGYDKGVRKFFEDMCRAVQKV